MTSQYTVKLTDVNKVSPTSQTSVLHVCLHYREILDQMSLHIIIADMHSLA